MFFVTPLMQSAACNKLVNSFDSLKCIRVVSPHLLLIVANAQVSNSLDSMLDVGLLVGLDVDVTFQTLFGHHRLDLKRLENQR